MYVAKGVFTLSDDGGADDGYNVTENCFGGSNAINDVSEGKYADNVDDIGSRGNSVDVVADARTSNVDRIMCFNGRYKKYRQHSRSSSSSKINATHFRHHILFFIIFGLCCAIKGNWAGFACLSNPCIFGVCIDDLNSTYSCYCIDGYTGVQCQTNWDECYSNPCLNGGICIDGVAQYNCSCPDGFVGQNCEENYDECLSNPCQNGGTCLDKDNSYICNCPVGFNGTHCEYDIAVCNAESGERCHNGGECIEGTGLSFTCQCAPGYDGTYCDNEINECNSSPCQNGGVCVDKLAAYSCACAFGYTGSNCEEEIMRCEDSPCAENSLCLMESGYPVCYCVPDYHGEKCEYQYDECKLSTAVCTNGGTCIDGVDAYHCSCPIGFVGSFCECLLFDNGTIDCNFTAPTYATSATPMYTSSNVQTGTSQIFTHDISFWSTTEIPHTPVAPTSELPTTIAITEETILTTELITSTTFDATDGTTTKGSSNAGGDGEFGETTTHFNVTRTSAETATATITDERASTEFELTTLEPNIAVHSTMKGFEQKFTTDNNIDVSISVTNGVDPVDLTTRNTQPATITTDIPTQNTTVDGGIFSSPSTDHITLTTIQPFFTASPNRTTLSTGFTDNSQYSTIKEPTSTTRMSASSSSFDGPETTTATWSTSTVINRVENTTVTVDCMKVSCLNGGTCVSSVDGDKCICHYNYQGRHCEQPIHIVNAAFGGDSYLSHPIYKSMATPDAPIASDSGLGRTAFTMQIELKARTRAMDGLILLAAAQATKGSHYMALFLHKGLLQFQFSCGLQTMLLSELETPVNTGHEILIQAELDFSRNNTHCNASLRVNDTLAMSGDQPTWIRTLPSGQDSSQGLESAWLHLGGTPQAPVGLISDMNSGQGFTGCLYALKINGEPTDIFGNALDGYGITECGSLACLSNPCRNGAICKEIDDNKIEDVTFNSIDGTAAINQRGEKWQCKCPNGYMGPTCEISVCNDNPCQHGATCVTFPGSGLLCLCPLGTHGHYCEHNLEVAQPHFSGSVNGLASYVAYPIPLPLEYNMELSFKIHPTTMSQISLLAFIGQSGYHDEKSDHFAVSFIQGYIMLTWNLGTGPRRIFTQKPIAFREDGKKVPFEIKVGRMGRQAWLAVEGANITGRSPGNLLKMDVVPTLYLGGHDIANFSSLPHDLPLHSGFQGCIFDVQFKTGPIVVPLQETRGVRGRSVGQCGTKECHRHACHNDGACLHHGATFTCICQEGWFGPMCTQPANPCDTGNNKCAKGSTCVPLVNGYECDCPIAFTGKNCDQELKFLSDVKMIGRRSYLSVKWPVNEAINWKDGTSDFNNNEIEFSSLRSGFTKPTVRQQNDSSDNSIIFSYPVVSRFIQQRNFTVSAPERLNPKHLVQIPSLAHHQRITSFTIEFQIRPLSERGLLLYFGAFDDHIEQGLGFVSVSLQGGVVEFRLASMTSKVTVVRSVRTLAIGEWHKIKVTQSGRRIGLWVEGSAASTIAASSDVLINKNDLIYVGGLPDLSLLPYNAISGFPVPYRGCVRKLTINGVSVSLNETNILESRNIMDCDGTACGADSCESNGQCWLDESMEPRCKCSNNSFGTRCEYQESCQINSCKNRGKCLRSGYCSCPNGWGGSYCEKAITKHATPSFRGNSYLVVSPPRIPTKDKRGSGNVLVLNRRRDNFKVSLNFSTINMDGLLFWSNNYRDRSVFLGMGLSKGHLKMASNLLMTDNATVDVPAGGFLADGGWHNVQIEFSKKIIQIIVDGRPVFLENNLILGTSKIDDPQDFLQMENLFYLGGFPDNISVGNQTEYKFTRPFSGCLQDISFGNDIESHISDFSAFDGGNIGSCDLYDDYSKVVI